MKKKTIYKMRGSLGINCKRKNELNDKVELELLGAAIKEVYFQDYKTAYDDSNNSCTEMASYILTIHLKRGTLDNCYCISNKIPES